MQASSFNLRDRFGNWWDNTNKAQRVIFRVAIVALFYAVPFLNNPLIDTPGTSFDFVLFYPLIMFALMSLGLNIVVGKSGILDLGYVAFFAIGAYTNGMLSTKTHLSFYAILIIGALLAMLAGVMLGLPALRLRGDYLAIITMGFGEIVRIVALNTPAIGAATGIVGIAPPPTMFGMKFTVMNPRPFYWISLTVLLLVLWGILRLSHRKPGRAWEAIREDEDVAEFMGVNTLKYKLWAFIAGGFVGGAAGVIYASQVRSIQPASFTLDFSIMILACVVFGGMGNPFGAMAGAVILGYLPEKLRFLSQTRIVFFGLLMIIMMNIRPDGLFPRKKREKILEKSN